MSLSLGLILIWTFISRSGTLLCSYMIKRLFASVQFHKGIELQVSDCSECNPF